jgi:isopenicillin N synthase-like dioxygenase
MDLDIISYHDLVNSKKNHAKLEAALLHKGIVGIQHIPEFEKWSRAYIEAARQFSALPETIKKQYAPDRDAGNTEGYELGAEWFKDAAGNWQIDDKKASYYAYVPDHIKNIWPQEVDLKTSYLKLGELIFNTGKLVLKAIGLDERIGLEHDRLLGYGRMLHYHKEKEPNANPDWCGAHFDHGVFTGLVPAYYFKDGNAVQEPEEAGLYITPTHGNTFEKIHADDKSILLFQVGQFGQLISNDRIRATRHSVKKATKEIERYTFAVFYLADDNMVIQSTSELRHDVRYRENQSADGKISHGQWHQASYVYYRAQSETSTS